MPKIISFHTGIIYPKSEVDEGANTPINFYLEDLVAILELPIGMKGLLFELTQRIDLEGIIFLTPTKKKQIAQRLNITMGTIDNYLNALVKTGVLKRRFRSCFNANPHIFDRLSNFLATTDSSSESAIKLREALAFKMQVAYDYSGGRKISILFPEE